MTNLWMPGKNALRVVSLQRRELNDAPSIARKKELNGSVAKAANSVVQENRHLIQRKNSGSAASATPRERVMMTAWRPARPMAPTTR